MFVNKVYLLSTNVNPIKLFDNSEYFLFIEIVDSLKVALVAAVLVVFEKFVFISHVEGNLSHQIEIKMN